MSNAGPLTIPNPAKRRPHSKCRSNKLTNSQFRACVRRRDTGTVRGMTNTNISPTSIEPAANVLADATIHSGEAAPFLDSLKEGCVHAVVTDPPYGLTSSLDTATMLTAWLEDEEFINDANGYGGADWDNAVPGPDLWRQVLRVLAPGGFALVFGASRTIGLTQVALQLAGFEVRDTWMWTYGGSRPTSRDLGKKAHELGDEALSTSLAGQRSTVRPAYEPILVARRPLEKLLASTVLENVLDFGVGAIDHSALAGPGHLASNFLAVHDPVCSPTSCHCELEEEAPKGATPLYPGEVVTDSALSVPKPTAKERPIVDGVSHPTVKPLALMRVLIRAVTREGQTVLDPFLGSGTTAEAALLEGRHVIGCERNAEFSRLIAARLERAREL